MSRFESHNLQKKRIYLISCCSFNINMRLSKKSKTTNVPPPLTHFLLNNEYTYIELSRYK